VSHLPGVVDAVRLRAEQGAENAQSVLDMHYAEGHSKITVTSGDVDSFVNLDDTRGDRAAAAIEFGRSGGRSGATQGINALGSAF
jgi:hypothetical protein